MVARVIYSLLLIFSIFFMPFWVSAALALVGLVYFSLYWEAVIAMLFSDLLFGTAEHRLGGLTFISFFTTFILLIAAELIKRKLKFYP